MSTAVLYEQLLIILFSLENASAIALLEGIIATLGTPHSILEVLTDHLLSISVKPEVEAPTLITSRRLLSLVQQRYPEILKKSVDTTCESDESLQEAVEQLLISLTMVSTTASSRHYENSLHLSFDRHLTLLSVLTLKRVST